MSKKTKKNIVSLTNKELVIVIEALGAYKKVLKSKAMRMMNKHGYSDNSKSGKRVDAGNTAMKKLTIHNK